MATIGKSWSSTLGRSFILGLWCAACNERLVVVIEEEPFARGGAAGLAGATSDAGLGGGAGAAGVSGAGVGGGPPGSCVSLSAFCDDFESPSPGGRAGELDD